MPTPGATADRPSPSPHRNDTLQQLAQRYDKYFGTAVVAEALAGDAPYSRLAGDQFGAVTPANEMKWANVEPVQGQYNWGPADKVVEFAEAHHQRIRGHNLLWWETQPDWVTNGTWTADQLKDVLKQHIMTEVGRYRGKIYAWDVINEPFNIQDGSWRDNIYYKTLGPEYVADAIRWAHEADPHAKLYINEYGIEGPGPKSDAMYDLAKSLKAQGVPLDGIGFESHFLESVFEPDGQASNFERFTDLDLDVAVTELDDSLNQPPSQQDLVQQGKDYTNSVFACLQVRRCVGITVWGFSDKQPLMSGIPGFGTPDMYDENYQPKPALDAVKDALADHHDR
ncbi:endo-1,4-beta-xylanase [Nocardia sp. NPDC004711]